MTLSVAAPRQGCAGTASLFGVSTLVVGPYLPNLSCTWQFMSSLHYAEVMFSSVNLAAGDSVSISSYGFPLATITSSSSYANVNYTTYQQNLTISFLSGVAGSAVSPPMGFALELISRMSLCMCRKGWGGCVRGC